jgi:hypothetical protein
MYMYVCLCVWMIYTKAKIYMMSYQVITTFLNISNIKKSKGNEIFLNSSYSNWPETIPNTWLLIKNGKIKNYKNKMVKIKMVKLWLQQGKINTCER